jgi:hypothetical protein
MKIISRADAGRRHTWITSCKRSSGLQMAPSLLPNCVSSSTRYRVVETRCFASLPRAALRLHGVLQIGRRTASILKLTTLGSCLAKFRNNKDSWHECLFSRRREPSPGEGDGALWRHDASRRPVVRRGAVDPLRLRFFSVKKSRHSRAGTFFTGCEINGTGY